MYRIKNKEGFTLIEIMITLAIFSIGLLAVVGMFISSIKGNAFGEDMTVATTLAQEKIEEFKTEDYANIISAAVPENVVMGSKTYTRNWTVTTNDPISGVKRVLVTVSWSDQSGSHSITLETLISRF